MRFTRRPGWIIFDIVLIVATLALAGFVIFALVTALRS